VSGFRWYRRWRGGRWARATGMLWGYRWVRVTPECRERVDEDWTVPDAEWHVDSVPTAFDHRVYTDDYGHVWHAWRSRWESGAVNLTACNRPVPTGDQQRRRG
jgi:hypothetical protein